MQIETAIWKREHKAGEVTILFLHGFGSNEHDLIGLSDLIVNKTANNYNFVSVRAPLELTEFQMFGGQFYAWLPIPVPENGEQFEKMCENATESLINWLNTNFSKDDVIIPFGFSQGALMVSELVKSTNLINCKIQCAVALSGFICESTTLKEGAVPTFFGFGNSDDIVSSDRLNIAANYFKSLPNSTVKSYSGLGHSIDEREMSDVAQFLQNSKIS